MKRLLVLVLAPLLALVFAAAPAAAASVHFKKGGSPTCTIATSTGTSSTTCSAVMAGLGNGDVDLALTVAGFALYQCQNGGGNTAPGQNKVLVGPVTEPTHIPGVEIKNGNLSFTTNPAVLTAPGTVTGAQAGCPNPNWTGVNPTLTTTSITLDISQSGALLFHCTASNPDGLTGTVALTC
jgi:hypothetical protein